ncbi:MAG: hypothetical protein GEU99_12835 [Luteitalea sp.]|nr:hypothetical protein [Luteitalea sp.]
MAKRLTLTTNGIFIWIVFLLSLFALTGHVNAQINLSTIRGVIVDQSQGVLPGVDVTVTEVNTNLSRSAVSDDNGNFELADLRPGIYRLTASLSGFRTYIADDVHLESGQTRRINMVLQIGDAAEQVTVTAGAAVISTENGELGAAVDTTHHGDAPWVGAEASLDPSLYLTTVPLVQSTGGVWSTSWAGQSRDQVQMGQDGHTNDRDVNQLNDIFDAQEIVVVPVNSSAEHARVGYMNMITKSGTNAFHGRLLYWNLNPAFKAREFFEEEKAKTLTHTISASASGPILKDKTFFYASTNILKVPSEQFYLRDVPTERMRAGDFSQLLHLSNPITLNDPLTGEPFPNNIIPENRINPVSQRVNDRYLPAPNRGASDDLSSNFGFTFPFPTDYSLRQDFTQRIDHKISDKNTLMGRFIENRDLYVLPQSFPEFTWTRERFNFHMVLQDTHVFSANLVNTARVGLYKEKITDGGTVYDVTPFKGDEAVAAIGLRGVNPQGLTAQGFPRMDISGYPSLQTTPGGMVLNDHNWGFADTVTWTNGKHTIKFGGEFKPQSRNEQLVQEPTYGRFAFNGSFTGYGYADFLLGIPYQSQRLDQVTDRVTLDNELGLFIMDDFKATDDLTLNVGLRWDRFGSATYEDGLIYNWDLATGNIVVPAEAIDRVSPLYPSTINVVAGQVKQNPKMTNFAPRLGLAYRVSDKLVVRGAYGIYTETLGRYSRAQGGGPFALTETYINDIVDGQPSFAFPNPFPSDVLSAAIPSQSFSGYPLDTDNGRIHQFNATLEYQLHDMGFRLSYIGARNRGMNYSIDINKPQPSLIPFSQDRRSWPEFVGGSYARSDGKQNYNALSLQAQRKLGGFTFSGHWTLTSNLSNMNNLEDPYAELTFSRVPYTSRQRAVVNARWELPIGRGRRFLADATPVVDTVLGGWQLYWIAYFESGFFFSPRFSGSDPSNTNTFGGLPDRATDGNLPSGERELDQWFDPSAFQAPPEGRFGNSGANILEGPGYQMHNISVSKSFDLTAGVRFGFTVAASNAFNHPNFGVPSSDISVPGSVGVVSSLRAGAQARQVELRSRIEW